MKPNCLAIACSGSIGFCTIQSALLGEQRLDHRHVFVLAGAARQHEAGRRERIERKFAEDEAHLAGIDVALLQFRKGRLGEMRAVRAGHRGIFDDGHRRLVGTEHDIAVGTGFRQIRRVGTGSSSARARRGETGQNGASNAGERKYRGGREELATGERQGNLLVLTGKCLQRNVAPARRSAKGLARRCWPTFASGLTSARDCQLAFDRRAEPRQRLPAGHRRRCRAGLRQCAPPRRRRRAGLACARRAAAALGAARRARWRASRGSG